jgi:hypothetical protein
MTGVAGSLAPPYNYGSQLGSTNLRKCSEVP